MSNSFLRSAATLAAMTILATDSTNLFNPQEKPVKKPAYIDPDSANYAKKCLNPSCEKQRMHDTRVYCSAECCNHHKELLKIARNGTKK